MQQRAIQGPSVLLLADLLMGTVAERALCTVLAAAPGHFTVFFKGL